MSRPHHHRKESAMNARPTLPRPRLGVTLVAAALAALIAIGLLAAVAGLLLRDGTPLARLVIAEHACADRAFVSERETCVRSFLVASPVRVAVVHPAGALR
jgi:hypothetical protein